MNQTARALQRQYRQTHSATPPEVYPGPRKAMRWHTITGARLLYWRAPGKHGGVLVSQYVRTGYNLSATSFTVHSL